MSQHLYDSIRKPAKRGAATLLSFALMATPSAVLAPQIAQAAYIGWQRINGVWYYYQSNGARKTGWFKDAGLWYYLNPATGAMHRSGWVKDGGTWYYLGSDGAMLRSRWAKYREKWYYLDSLGRMVTDWQKIGGLWYFFNEQGAMLADAWQGDYYLGSDGAMLRSQWVGDRYVGASGKWDRNKAKDSHTEAKEAALTNLANQLAEQSRYVPVEGAPVMLRSYETSIPQLQNTAFTYDNALVAMAFLSEGRSAQAATILDAFVYAQEYDRAEAGRIRNAYASGSIFSYAGWGSAAKLPGWYDMASSSWYEDAYQVGSNTGNTSYAMLALLHGYEQLGDTRYLSAARRLGDWLLANCQDGRDGFTAGQDGWPEAAPPVVTHLTYKSTEHNIDAMAAFVQLYVLTGDARYKYAAESAKRFVLSMYDARTKLFYTGTEPDGRTVSTSNVVLDAQVWAALALGEGFEPYAGAWETVARMRTPEGGYHFHQVDEPGFWCEGTAFTALAQKQAGQLPQAEASLAAIEAYQRLDGGFPAATAASITTGFYLADGTQSVYRNEAHIAPSAWYILAVNGYNPYTF